MADDAGSQQRMVAALGYLFPPVVPLIVLTSDMKRDAFMQRHAAQALIWTVGFLTGFVLLIVAAIWMLRTELLLLCLFPVLFLLPFAPGSYWAWRVHQGGDPRPALIAPLAKRLFPAR